MLSRSGRVWVDGLVPLGGYWRRRPLVFSLLPRCHGLCGSQKNIGMAVATLNLAWRAISVPWSQVSNRLRQARQSAHGPAPAARSALCGRRTRAGR